MLLLPASLGPGLLLALLRTGAERRRLLLVFDAPLALLGGHLALQVLALDLGLGLLLAQSSFGVGTGGLRRLLASLALRVGLGRLQAALARQLILAGRRADHLLHLADELAGHTSDGALFVLIMCHWERSPRMGWVGMAYPARDR